MIIANSAVGTVFAKVYSARLITMASKNPSVAWTVFVVIASLTAKGYGWNLPASYYQGAGGAGAGGGYFGGRGESTFNNQGLAGAGSWNAGGVGGGGGFPSQGQTGAGDVPFRKEVCVFWCVHLRTELLFQEHPVELIERPASEAISGVQVEMVEASVEESLPEVCQLAAVTLEQVEQVFNKEEQVRE